MMSMSFVPGGPGGRLFRLGMIFVEKATFTVYGGSAHRSLPNPVPFAPSYPLGMIFDHFLIIFSSFLGFPLISRSSTEEMLYLGAEMELWDRPQHILCTDASYKPIGNISEPSEEG